MRSIFSPRRLKSTLVTWQDNVATSALPPINSSVTSRGFTDFIFNEYAFSEQPDTKKAIVEDEHVRTFGDLRRDVPAIRKYAEEELKLKKGDTVTFISPNSVDYFSIVHGFCSAGVVVSPVNPVYTHQEIEFQLKQSRSKAVVTHVSCLESTEKAAKAVGMKDIIVLDEDSALHVGSHSKISDIRKGARKVSDPVGKIVASGSDIACLPFSSGTTGLPKGTMLSHGNLCANIAQFDTSEVCFWKPEEPLISPLPMFHIYGFTVSLNLALAHGTTIVTMKRFDMEKFCQAVQDYKCGRGHIVPPIVLGLAKSPIVSKYDMSSLKVLISAAAPLGADMESMVMKRFPGLLQKQAWGMSELSPVASMTLDSATKKGSVGVPVASTAMKVVDLNTRKPLPPNTDGELLVKGPQVMQGYLNEPQKTKDCLCGEGWLSTGDIARIDEDGFIFITDRLKELIKFKGFQVAPAELEALLLTHHAVMDAVVIPRPDKEADEVPRAYVVLKPQAQTSESELVEWAAKETAHYKRIRGGIKFVEKIPKTASGKILRREVVEMDRKTYPVN